MFTGQLQSHFHRLGLPTLRPPPPCPVKASLHGIADKTSRLITERLQKALYQPRAGPQILVSWSSDATSIRPKFEWTFTPMAVIREQQRIKRALPQGMPGQPHRQEGVTAIRRRQGRALATSPGASAPEGHTSDITARKTRWPLITHHARPFSACPRPVNASITAGNRIGGPYRLLTAQPRQHPSKLRKTSSAHRSIP